MSVTPSGLTADELRTVFPFHFALDRRLRLVQAGHALARLWPDVTPGMSMAGRLRIVRPDVPLEFDAISAQLQSLFVIDLLPQGLPLRGRVLADPDEGRLLFLCGPWITELADLIRYGLTLSDFPAHEPVSEYLFLLQSQKTALENTRTLADRLEAQTRTLRETVRTLDEKESTLHAIVDTAADGIITVDRGGIVRSFNAAACRMFGYAADEVIGRNVSMLMPPDIASQHDEFLARYLQTGTPHIIGAGREVEGQRRDGTRFPLHLSVSDVAVGTDRVFTGIARDLTDRERAAADLRAIQAKLQQTLTAAGAGAWEWNFQTRQAYWSEGMYRLTGIEPGTVVTPERFLAAFHPEDRTVLVAQIDSAVRAGMPLEGEHRVVWADGSVHWVRNVGSVQRDGQGRPLRMSGIATDVTAARLAEHDAEAIRSRAERRSAVQLEVTSILARETSLEVATAPVLGAIGDLIGWDVGALWIVDASVGLLRCMGTWQRTGVDCQRFLQATRETTFERGIGIPGRIWQSGQMTWLPDVARDDNFPRMAVAGHDGLHAAFGLPISQPQGVIGVIEFFSRRVQAPDREVINMLDTVGREVGQFIGRIEAQEGLRLSEQQMRLVVDTSLDAIVSIDADGAIVDWSRQAETMFGWTRDEAVGQRLDALIVPHRHREAHRRGMAHYHATGQGPALNRRLEMEALHRDGREFPIELAIAVVRPWAPSEPGHAPRPFGSRQGSAMFSAFIRDITDRHAAEAGLRRAKEDAEAAARARSEFLAMMSHEIRTPLHGVIGMLDLLRETPLADDQRRQLDLARRSARSLVAITNDVLDFSKITAGRLIIERRPFDLGELVDEVAAIFRPQAAAGGVELRVRYPRGRPGGVIGDSVRVGQILTNLVGNAVKFTLRGHVEVAVVREDASAPDGSYWRFTVEDTGGGVPEDKQTTIFDAFAQGDDSTTRRFGGTGLGLPISASLAEAMSGHLRLVRSSAAGSVFELTLPLPVTVLAAEPAGAPAPVRPRAGGRVLVVDDHALNREIASVMLRRLGCSVTAVGSGAEAVALVQRERFDLVFMDCLMPDMDGYEATRTIRGLGFAPGDLPIVAMTASALPADRVRCLDAGMNDHMTKPILDDVLAQALAQWIPDGRMPVLDLDKVGRTRDLMNASPSSWDAVVASFIEDGQQTVDGLGTALEAGALEALGREAHRLKGSSGMMAAVRLAAECAELEAACADGAVEACAGLVNRVARTFAETAEALRAIPAP